MLALDDVEISIPGYKAVLSLFSNSFSRDETKKLIISLKTVSTLQLQLLGSFNKSDYNIVVRRRNFINNDGCDSLNCVRSALDLLQSTTELLKKTVLFDTVEFS